MCVCVYHYIFHLIKNYEQWIFENQDMYCTYKDRRLTPSKDNIHTWSILPESGKSSSQSQILE
jgi:hypothetical protein